MTQFTDDIVRRGQFLKLGFARKWLEQQKRCVWQNNGQPACQFTEESGASNGDGHGGNPQDCQPQNWLLVANPEVGNSEYVHYSGLPTPIIYRNSGYNAPQPTLISTW